MAGIVLKNGTAYTISGGVAKVGGAAYNITGGKVMKNGVVYDISFISKTLEENSWALIRAASDAGTAANYWSVGDVKNITINGTVGNTSFSNLKIGAFILGFNHNSSREGANRIHFQIGKVNGTLAALCDSKYNTLATTSGYFRMNNKKSNTGGWESSYMRKTLLGNTNTPNSPLSGSLMAALPLELRAVIKPCTKYSDNAGNESSAASNVTATTDYLFMLAAFEYRGAGPYNNKAEDNYQAQYDYYKAGNSRVHYQYNATTTTVSAWCRSVVFSTGYSFCCVGTGGNVSANNAHCSLGVDPGFCV